MGLSGGTAIIILIALYFIVMWAVKNGVKETYKEISGKEAIDDLDEILENEATKQENREKVR